MISVITPVWNRADLTAEFLNKNWQLYQNREETIEFVVIDNGSTDGTPFLLENWYKEALRKKPFFRTIANPENRGFAIASNQGAAPNSSFLKQIFAPNDSLLFLNNDVLIRGDYLAPIIAHLRAHPAGLVGAELLTHDTGWNVFNGQTIPYIPGWCLAMTRKTFDDLGGFDERYSPGDYEDIDLCYTAAQAGRKLHALSLPLVHLFNQTGRQLPDRLAMTERHRQLFAEKWGFNGRTN